MIDRVLVFEDFADKVGDVFALGGQDAPDIALSLVEAEPLPNRLAPGSRAPFSLVFRAGDPLVLPQRLYRLTHNTLGELTIFLVPVGKDGAGVSYQATFS